MWLIGLVWQKNMYLFLPPVYPVVVFRQQEFCLCMFCFLNWFGNGIKLFFFLSAGSFEDDKRSLITSFLFAICVFLLLMTDMNNHSVKNRNKCLHHVNTMLNVSGSWDGVFARWYCHHLLTGNVVPFKSINPKADYCASAAASILHHNPCIKKIYKIKPQQQENMFPCCYCLWLRRSIWCSAQEGFFFFFWWLKVPAEEKIHSDWTAAYHHQAQPKHGRRDKKLSIRFNSERTLYWVLLYRTHYSTVIAQSWRINVNPDRFKSKRNFIQLSSAYLALHQQRAAPAKLTAGTTNLANIVMIANKGLDSHWNKRHLLKGWFCSGYFLSIIFSNSVLIKH